MAEKQVTDRYSDKTISKHELEPGTVLLNTARNYKELKTVQRATRYYKELQDTLNRSTK